MQLTAAGEAFLEKAENVVRQTEQAEAAARRPGTGTLRIGFVCPAARRVLPDALRTLRSRHPGGSRAWWPRRLDNPDLAGDVVMVWRAGETPRPVQALLDAVTAMELV